MDYMLDPHETKDGTDVFVIMKDIHNPGNWEVTSGKIIQSPSLPDTKTIWLQNSYCKLDDNHVLFRTEQEARNYYKELFQ
ncbi:MULTISPECIES: transcriptional regulator SplA domain-containing protein [Thalassobacillus]|uniref:transcriptional regulator SplA domain-containing protein n=1 Tax=Thalassobacillus TaxID=331971 RepID=UPI000A1CE92F|nr:transcriptional regulator SplA domain-containing protein [Thalassobacillus devorans]